MRLPTKMVRVEFENAIIALSSDNINATLSIENIGYPERTSVFSLVLNKEELPHLARLIMKIHEDGFVQE